MSADPFYLNIYKFSFYMYIIHTQAYAATNNNTGTRWPCNELHAIYSYFSRFSFRQNVLMYQGANQIGYYCIYSADVAQIWLIKLIWLKMRSNVSRMHSRILSSMRFLRPDNKSHFAAARFWNLFIFGNSSPLVICISTHLQMLNKDINSTAITQSTGTRTLTYTKHIHYMVIHVQHVMQTNDCS